MGTAATKSQSDIPAAAESSQHRVAVGEVSWERMIRAVEKVRERLRRAVAALEAAGIPYAVADAVISGPVQLVGAGLREDFDTPMPQPVVFRRKRVLVDSDFTDGLFRRQGAGREPIDVNL